MAVRISGFPSVHLSGWLAVCLSACLSVCLHFRPPPPFEKIIPEKVELRNSIFLAPLKIVVFPFFLENVWEG